MGGINAFGGSLPLWRRPQLVSQDLEQIRDHMSGVFMPHHIRTSGRPPIAFTHNQALLRQVSLNAIDYGLPYGDVTVSVPEILDCFLVQFSLKGSCEIRMGRRQIAVPNGHMCVISPNSALSETLSSGYKHFTMRIPYQALEEALTLQLGYRPDSALCFSFTPLPLSGGLLGIARLMDAICDDLNSDTPAFTHPRMGKTIEDSVLQLLLASVPHNFSRDLDSPSAGPAPYYVRRVEDYIRQNAGEPIGMTELVEVSGVSARSLHLGFRRFRNTTPMGYLKAYRLDLARTELENAYERSLSVTEVAFSCGFMHLSKFARDYTRRFGENPSATRRRCDR
jgi:AraC-like DNA-binding protein